MWHPPLYVTFSVRLYVCGAAYIRNHISCDHNFWYTFAKWWYFQVYHFIFQSWFFEPKREKNGPKWIKKENCQMPYLRNSIAYVHNFWCTYVKWWYLQVSIFHFPKFWSFGLLAEFNKYKIAAHDRERVRKVWHTWRTWANTNKHILGVIHST